jgi:thymidylate synthase
MTGEVQYLKLISRILKKGTLERGRNGNTRVLIGNQLRFSLENNTIPIITTKKMAWDICLKELLWFIKGDTNNDNLTKDKVKIWNGNSTREFLDSRGLHHLKENDLGPIYGFQWRFFNAKYNTCHDDYTGQGIDQLQNIIDELKDETKRNSRRLIMTAWNPLQLNEMALPPCHVMSQFHITNGNELSCTLYQRSGDVGLGIPFNIASYSFLTHLIATHCNLVSKEFVHFIGNAHIYEDHTTSLLRQLHNVPFEPPKVYIHQKENINDYDFDDFIVEHYNHHDAIKMDMIV